MSLTSTLLKAGALYALGRMTTNISGEDISRLTGINGDDVRRYGLGRADALLGTLGLTRAASVPSSTALVLSGFAAGAVVGAGATFLFYSEQGKDVRKKIAEYFASTDDNEASADADANVTGNGGVKARA
ncbi:MAG: hypothetical protein VYE22_30145 [Myxococcota bacterium]|nr:hypothetical protein [Myxococcota bacterium]